jgi:two-component system invasion response regulator UvrY
MSPSLDSAIRIAYFDDQLLFREALTRVMEDTGEVVVIRSCGHQDTAIRASLNSPVSVVLAALDGQTNDPMVTIREVRQSLPEVPICVLVTLDRLSSTREALLAGCNGAVSTSASLTMLVAAIANLSRGQAFVDPMLGGRLIARTASRSCLVRHKGNSLEAYSSNNSEIPKMTGGKTVS